MYCHWLRPKTQCAVQLDSILGIVSACPNMLNDGGSVGFETEPLHAALTQLYGCFSASDDAVNIYDQSHYILPNLIFSGEIGKCTY